jgi:hypothetical protein
MAVKVKTPLAMMASRALAMADGPLSLRRRGCRTPLTPALLHLRPGAAAAHRPCNILHSVDLPQITGRQIADDAVAV